MMRIDISELAGSELLAGSQNGKRLLVELLTVASEEPTDPIPLFLDFAGVLVATASFLRESVLAFRDLVRGRRSNFYPVIANANREVCDELNELVGPQRSDVLVACDLDESDKVVDLRLIGSLEPVQRRTLNFVIEQGETDARSLMLAHGDEERTTHTTAWNNRLASLAYLGLLVEKSHGRAKRYSPLFAGM